MQRPLVTRFAPSPTGHLHIGGARTALFCWAYARGRGGRFMLRVEDTDQARSSEASARGILEDLAWLGIGWDDGPRLEHGGAVLGGDSRGVGPYFQAQRLEIYNEIVERMVEADLAYPAFDTAGEMEAARKAAAARKETYRYRRAAGYDRGAALGRMRAGEAHVVRFKFPEEPVHVSDAVLGEIKFAPEHVDDFVLRKADGFPTYHFAVVVDDELMGVTHVLRGQEHLNNTPRHVALQRALGYRTPVYAHMPLIFNMDGSKMSKRDKDKAAREAAKKKGVARVADVAGAGAALGALGDGGLAEWMADTQRQLPPEALRELATALAVDLPEIEVEDFRRAGYLPEVVCNFIALLGWSPGTKDAQGKDVEKFDRAFLAANFDLDRIGKTNAKFDRVKLASFNGDAIAQMPDAEFAAAWLAWMRTYEPGAAAAIGAMEPERLAVLLRAVKPRAKTMREGLRSAAFALLADDAVPIDPGAAQKHLLDKDGAGLGVLAALRPVLAALAAWAPETIHGALEAFAKERGLGMGAVAQPVRVAVAGVPVSPALGDTLAVVGQTGTLRRIDAALRLRPGA